MLENNLKKKIYIYIYIVPMGKGEAKAIIKPVIIQNWQREWEEKLNSRHYHKAQVNVKQGKWFIQ